ncbi:MAG: hypothetical protein FWE21_08365 [Defluviitaleaceae bacterium]|nr:hypothetical protein [Defluviitaleaceae bacterium]
MRNKKFALKFVAISAVSLALLTFNWDRVEMENRAFVVVMGIEAGEGDKTSFSVYLSVVDAPALENGGEDAPKLLYQAEGASLSHALSQAGGGMSDRLYYGHTKAIVIHKDALENPRMVREIADTLSQKGEINIRTIVMATDKPVSEILQTKPKGGNLLGTYLSNYFGGDGANVASLAIKADLEGFDASLRRDGTAVLPKITLEGGGDGKEINIGGIFALKNFAYIDSIPEELLAGQIWVKENAGGMELVLDDHTALQIIRSRPKITFAMGGDNLICHVKIQATGNLVGLHSLRNNSELNADFTKKIESQITTTHGLFQYMGVDGLMLTETLHKKYPNIPLQPIEKITIIPEIHLEIKAHGS